MPVRKKFSYKKFEKDRNKATDLSKSGFRLDTLSDELYRTTEARKKAVKNTCNLSDIEYARLREKLLLCDNRSTCDWCMIPVIKRIKPECGVCEYNT